jgi:hypothetical protein
MRRLPTEATRRHMRRHVAWATVCIGTHHASLGAIACRHHGSISLTVCWKNCEIDVKTAACGISVNSVEIRDVAIPVALQGAMPRQLHSDRE